MSLTLNLVTDAFNNQLDRAYKKDKSRGRISQTDYGHEDESLVTHGIIVNYHDDYK
jgi:hypothetical protein